MTEEPSDPVEIPYSTLSDDALRGVVEAYVLREGTEYGARDYSLEEKVERVIAQLARGEAKILFDPNSNQVAVVTAKEASGAKPPDR